jgi:flavin-dependent dehydrogenase
LGETLPPESNPLLRRLGLWETFKRSGPLESPGIVSYWGYAEPLYQDFLALPHGCGWHVDRLRFDALLLEEAARAGVAVSTDSRVMNLVREGDRWLAGDIAARFLVDAAGRNGLRVDRPAVRQVDDRLVALTLRISHPVGRTFDLRTLISSCPAGWWYLAPMPDGISSAMFFTSSEEYKRLRAMPPANLAQEAPGVAERIESGSVIESRWISVTSSVREIASGPGWLAVGDSFAALDPLSGRGIVNALRHAPLAAQAVDGALRSQLAGVAAFEAQVRREFTEYLLQRRLHYLDEKRWPSAPFWFARHN